MAFSIVRVSVAFAKAIFPCQFLKGGVSNTDNTYKIEENMKKIIVLISMFFACGISNADTLKSKDEAKKLIQQVMGKVAKGDSEGGIKLLQPYFVIPDHEFEGLLDSLKMQAPAMKQRFGKTIGTELCGIDEVGDSLMLIMYIQKFEKHVMRWKFYFYKPNDKWVLNTFFTDDKIQLMFKSQ